MNLIDFETLFSLLPSPYMVLDRELRYVAANRAYERAVMRRRDELVGERIFDLFPNDGDSGRRLMASFQRVIESGESDTIAFIPYEIARPASAGGGVEQRYWTAIHTPLLGETGAVAFILQNTVDVTEFIALQEAASLPFRTLSGGIELLQRAREAETAYQASLSESADFRRLFQEAPGMIAVLQGPEHVFTFANDACRRLVGGRALIGLPLADALPEIEGQGFHELFDGVYKLGRPHIAEGQSVLLRHPGEAAPRETILDVSYHPIRDAAGRTTGIFVQAADRTEHFRALARQQLMVDELNHRVKNTLATVQAIARQSFKQVAPEDARASFEARIQALSNAHDALSAGHWEGVQLSVLLRQELAPFGTHRIEMAGPEVDLSPRAAIAFAMVFHELAANAAQYGSLSSEAGSLDIAWGRETLEARRRLSLCWHERGGPGGSPLARRGYGTRMLTRIIEGELDGHLDLDLGTGGLMCRLEVPLSEVERIAGSPVF